MDHYSTLGVAKTATQEEIKKAYRKLASSHHPDRDGGDTAKFQSIQAAYDIISDPQKRQEYDNPRPQFQNGPGGFHFQSGGFPPGMEDIFASMFGQGRNPRQPQTPTFRTTIFVSLEQAYHGGEQPLRLQTQQGASTVNITVPRGVPDGGQLKFDNAIPGGVLLAEFRTHKHLKFDRHGDDLVSPLPISVLDLIVGTKMKFETLSGKSLEVTIPPKTQPYFQMRLADYGMPIMNTNNFGDQILVLKPFMPDGIPEQLMKSIKEYQTNSI